MMLLSAGMTGLRIPLRVIVNLVLWPSIRRPPGLLGKPENRPHHGLGFGVLFAVNSAPHNYLIASCADNAGVSRGVAFYCMETAMGRLLGTALWRAPGAFYLIALAGILAQMDAAHAGRACAAYAGV